MSSLNKIKKNIQKNTLRFPIEMYTSPHGSLVISAYMFAENKPKVSEIKSKWKNLCKNFNVLEITLDKETFIPDLCNYFHLPIPKHIAMVQSDFNVLFAPYIEGNLLPVREDGVYTKTLRDGKIYPIEMGGE